MGGAPTDLYFLRLNSLAPLVRGSESHYSVFWMATHVPSATERVAKGLGKAQEGKVSGRSRRRGYCCVMMLYIYIGTGGADKGKRKDQLAGNVGCVGGDGIDG